MTRLEEKRDKHGWYINVVKHGTGKLIHIFWMSDEKIVHAQHFPHVIFYDNIYRSTRYDLNVALPVRVNNYGQSVLMGQFIAVGKNIRDFEYRSTGWVTLAWRPWLCSRMHV